MNDSTSNTKKKTASHEQPDFHLEDNPLNEIKRTIAIISGKGGVGKSLVTGLLATYLARTGNYRVGILDADITGPSIPRLFGADDFKPRATEAGLFPVRSHSDIQLMSINLLLDEPDSPVVWRGPILANTVKQFWTDVIWGDLDFMFLDMPPGTGDVPLTVFQSIPLDGIIIVTSPQDLVSMIVKKAVNMARMMNIPILGIVENMSHVICPHCGETIKLFGESTIEAVARAWDIPYLGSLPIDPELARLCDAGQIERVYQAYLPDAVAALERLPAHGEWIGSDAGKPVESSHPSIEQDHLTEQPERDVGQSGQKADGQNDKKREGQANMYRKIAIAAEGSQVSEHFGHCEGFMIYDTDVVDGSIVTTSYMPNPGHKPGLLPNLLNDAGVQIVIAGGMGSGAIDIFNEKGIDVITGATGPLDQVIGQYLDGTLVSSESICHEHQHADSCGEPD